MVEYNKHQRITDAGWAYRTNDRGWMIYRDPETGTWYTQSEAASIVQARIASGDGPDS